MGYPRPGCQLHSSGQGGEHSFQASLASRVPEASFPPAQSSLLAAWLYDFIR